MVERLLERGKTSRRVDDNEETIRKRLHTFQLQTKPVINHYQQLDKIKKVRITGKGVFIVHALAIKFYYKFSQHTLRLMLQGQRVKCMKMSSASSVNYQLQRASIKSTSSLNPASAFYA